MVAGGGVGLGGSAGGEAPATALRGLLCSETSGGTGTLLDRGRGGRAGGTMEAVPLSWTGWWVSDSDRVEGSERSDEEDDGDKEGRGDGSG